MSDVAIRLVGVRKTFGAQEVLRGVDLEARKGEVTVVIGRSGSGKSVLLKHVLGLLRPDAGQIWLGDQELVGMKERELRKMRFRCGMVFQHAALFDSMDVFDNVAFPLREHTKLSEREIAERVEGMLAAVGLRGASHKHVSQLSGGMRKRVGLARALVRGPDFLLYDEPTTGLDPIMTAQIDALIRETQDQNPGLTSLVISHDMHATFHIADHIAMLYEGRIVMSGTPEEFRDTPDPLVRQFVEGRLDGPIQA
jgi:phospholipid/cholesterol/gamma-HCH transport system ATP-binding protein